VLAPVELFRLAALVGIVIVRGVVQYGGHKRRGKKPSA
jgi:hypothetical protein